MARFRVWKTQQASRGSLATCCWIKERCFRESLSWFRKVCSISGFVYCVFLCGTNKLEPKKPDALAGYSLSTAALFLSWEPQTYSVLLRTTRLRIVGLIDEIINKRIHIEEKIRRNFLSICLRSQWFITPCCYDHIRNDKCPNDSRRIMPFIASVPFSTGSSQESLLWRTLR